MKNEGATTKRRKTIQDLYRELFKQPELTDAEIDETRENVIRLTQTVCEHAWKKNVF